MSRIEFLDEDGNVIGETHVPKIRVTPTGSRTPLSESARRELAAIVICSASNEKLGAIRENGTIALGIPGSQDPWLSVKVTADSVVGSISSNDVLDINSWSWTERGFDMVLESISIPCVHCSASHSLLASEAVAALNSYLMTRRKATLTV